MSRPILATAVLALLTLVRLLVAGLAPLAPDEAYYWIWSRALAPGYLDHPPMVALWIRAGTALLGETPLGVRLLGPVSVALGSLMLADAANRLLAERRAGVTAAALLNATLLLGVGTVIMTPDTPLIFFWTAALWAASRLLSGGDARWWLAIGGFAALALASKYTAVLLWGGLGLWLIISPAMRPWLLRPWPWLGTLFGAALFLPVVLWNANHGWAGFLRQGGRVTEWRPERALQYLGELVGGQIGLATPGIWLLCVAGIGLTAARTWRTRDARWTLLAVLTLPPLILFLQHALRDRVQGNWPAVIYPAAAIAAAGLVAPTWRRLRWPSVGLGLSITVLVYVQATTFRLPLPQRLDPVALRLAGWERLARDIDAVRRETGAAFVAADQYALAAELAWTLPPGVPVLGAEERWALFRLPLVDRGGSPGLLVRDARDGSRIDPAIWRDHRVLTTVSRTVRGSALEQYRLYWVVPAGRPSNAASPPGPSSAGPSSLRPSSPGSFSSGPSSSGPSSSGAAPTASSSEPAAGATPVAALPRP